MKCDCNNKSLCCVRGGTKWTNDGTSLVMSTICFKIFDTVEGFVTLSKNFMLLIATQFLENCSILKQV
jgi:hypothetical protein